MDQDKDSHDRNLDKSIDNIISQNLAIEREWLRSIKAPVKELPRHVADAVCARVLFSTLPRDTSRGLAENAKFLALINQIDKDKSV